MIEIKNLSKTYRMGQIDVQALRQVSLKILPGEFVAIMGPSGSGKSTLLHVLGLLDRPDSGEYLLGQKKVHDLPDEDISAIRNRLVGFVFQQFYLLPRMTAMENVALPLIYAGKQSLKANAKQKLEDVGLANRIDHMPNELSGGQQQRVAIARALVNDPLIIMADEPTGNLDSKSKEEIISILKELNQKGKTIVMVTHENEVAAHARRIIYMRDGQILSDKQNVASTVLPFEKSADQIIEVVLSRAEKATREAKFLDYLRQAAAAMIAHKMRSFLSILGVLIGVAAVIAMLAIGQGAKESIEKQLSSLGSNLLMVRPGSAMSHGIALQTGTVTRFTFQDISAIRKLTDIVKRVSASVTGRGQLVYMGKNWNTQVQGVDVDYAAIRDSGAAVGRFFTEDEVRQREKVALVGTTVAQELFGEINPVGESIKINLNNFKVIGVLPQKGASPFQDQDDTVIIPITTAMYRVFGKEYIDSIYVEAINPEAINSVQDEVTNVIIKQHHLNKEDSDSFQIRNMADIKNTLETTTKTMSLLLGAIAAISLLVGGIGVMNIMLVSVTERTSEIGLRKAIGANKKDIMVQFLIEAVLMSLIGGIAGVGLGAGAAILITFFAGWAVKVSLFSVILATLFSLFIGVVFGLWPANQASKLNPIEALRYQ